MGRLSIIVFGSLVAASAAHAHVRITSPTPRSSADLKERHCGRAGSTRANVQTFRPGATLRLVWDEYIPHPGYLRISFNPTGDVFRIPPPGPGGGFPTEDLTGMTDPGGSGSVIIADRIPSGTTSRDITLPTTECTNCTLQLIQMMTDKPPYTTDALSNDIYFACVDLVISATAPIVDAGPTPDGGNGGAADGGDVANEITSSCGCQGGGAGSAGLALAVAAALALPRRRRRA